MMIVGCFYHASMSADLELCEKIPNIAKEIEEELKKRSLEHSVQFVFQENSYDSIKIVIMWKDDMLYTNSYSTYFIISTEYPFVSLAKHFITLAYKHRNQSIEEHIPLPESW